MTSKFQFVGEKVKLGDFISASGERNKSLCCTDVYSVTNSLGFTPSAEYFSKEVFSKDLKTYRVVRRGMIAYNPSRINVGSVALQDKRSEVIVSPLYVVFGVDEGRLLPEFLLRFLKSRRGLEQIASSSTGTVRNNLKFNALCDMEICLPSLACQRECVDRLKAISNQISSLDLILGRLDQLVKSRFVEMFGDPNDDCFRWRRLRLDAFCRIVTGNTPPRRRSEYFGDYIEWIKTDNITAAPILTRALEGLSEEGAKVGRIAPKGSILMACIAGSVNSIGKVAIADRDVAFNQQINAIVPDDKVLVEYLYWLFVSSKSYLCSDVNMQLKGILNKTTLSRKEFPLPPLALQQQFADFVAQVDKPRFVATTQIGNSEPEPFKRAEPPHRPAPLATKPRPPIRSTRRASEGFQNHDMNLR